MEERTAESHMTNRSFIRGIATGLGLLLVSLLLAACTTPASTGAEKLTLGEVLYRLIVGGPAISEVTLLRFYTWHVIALPIIMLALIIWHGFRVRRDGGVSSPERPTPEEKIERVERVFIIRKETLTFFLTIAGLVIVSVFVDPPIGPAAEIGALTDESKAPWVFLWVQELLRIWPPAIAGVLSPLAVLLALTLLPYMDWSNEGMAVWFNWQGRIAQVVLLVLFVAVVGLTVRAALR
jgi:quinol-cytochrome oxidoreductase complex cytochrome b subunit